MTKNQIIELEKNILSYLHKNYDHESLYKFDIMDWKHILKSITRDLSSDDVSASKIILKRTLQDFLGSYGTVHLMMNPESVRVKIEVDKQLIYTIKLLEHFSQHLKQNSETLYCFDEAVTQALVEKLNLEEEAFRETVRSAIPYVFDLGERYSILFGNEKIIIRTFIEKGGNEKRYSGIPKEDLEALAQTIFQDIKADFITIFTPILEKRVDFSTINNLYFEVNIIKIIQKELMTFLKKKVSQDTETIKALANYILRENFYNAHEILAKKLLANVIARELNCETFLSYYIKGTISEGGIKYKVPSLLDKDGVMWSIPNIKNVTMQYENLQKDLQKKVDIIEKMEDVLDHIDEDIKSEKETLLAVKRESLKASQGLINIVKNLDVCRQSIKVVRSSKTVDQVKEKALVEQLQNLLKQENDFVTKNQSSDPAITKQENRVRNIISKKESTIIRLNTEIDKVEAMEEKSEKLISRYNQILSSLATALSQKRAVY